MRIGYLFALVPAIAGVVLGAIAYLRPETGVDGTPGALLAMVGAAATVIGGFLAMLPAISGRLLKTLIFLTGLAAFLTAIAAWFLMQYAFAIVMVLALVSLGVALAIPNRRVRA
ncbi:hypothetical protein [Chelativorans sp. Marseille-P2723]|uniref:hypothetical protein n=1 Tax=Chelativorans sp. Marseille-P2723 TaxID=2709133 RepID=UPI00157042A5|nr:hypothetical protein [Chelativorans sp. Marseille-P2723]